MEEKYLTLKLTVTEVAPNKFRSRIDASPLGASEAAGPGSDFELSADQVREWATRSLRGYVPTRAALEDIGKQLFGLIFKGPVLEKYKECVAVANERNARLRIGLAIVPPLLTAVPWEFVHDGKSFLLKGHNLLIRLIDFLPERAAYFRPIRRILVVIANPTKAPEQFTSFDAAGHIAELRTRLGSIAIDEVLVDPNQATLKQVLGSTMADALYFLGHGRHGETLGGQLVLADPDGVPIYLDADKFAELIRESPVRFVYLNSCSTAATGLTNPFSGVAQRLMLDGQVDAVVAMQTPVAQTAGLTIAKGFFEEVGRGRSPELALSLARTDPDDFSQWGVPVVYSYLNGADDWERNQLATLLDADVRTSRYGLILPTFGMGIHLDGVGEVDVKPKGIYSFPANPLAIKVKVDPPKTFVFPGDTHAREDVESAVDILGLLARVADQAKIDLYDSTDKGEDVTHWFLFGSRSNKIVGRFLDNYSARFRFDYGKKWSLEEVGRSRVYSVDAPNKLGKRKYADREDFGIIEKTVVNAGSKRVFFIIAGLGSRATRGCGWWLARNWKELVWTFVDRPFGVVLRFPAGMTFDYAEWVNRPAAPTFLETQNDIAMPPG